ncbi:DISARM system SNF2-like helicase DrmD [Spirulina major CS-329]|uniref:DISARM system SNF2-like helicase DrmD n=1 Tax=Spirulina TaxID=1154 RepID=UPI00232C3D6F|nr:DISARM system SNF2-like helicase DrmD [Spirulina major]MDB9504716.1 DISARM system SNF2-like helicase DrmD [Spirulina major CS-329]
MLPPALGQVVQVRSRRYLVESITPSEEPEGDTTITLACLDDDAQGQALTVFWERELDAEVLGKASWSEVTQRGFDRVRQFSAYFHALRWNCVTATNPKLFQAPYRAGIQVKSYQLEPLRKALLMPRVSLFIADDVGLGKTIEAGLILRELLLRQKVRRVVISCPPSVVQQWQEEMVNRFGLLFQIFDRAFVSARRRERGYGINPWKTHNLFIISHALLRDETYAAPLRDWLGDFAAGSLLILDEAHNAAPASAARYAIDSQLTKVVRDVSRRFEHKLFLSATPHNGHSNSFAALLEMLDPQRFCRGVPVKSKKLLDAVMVRRLKQDLRAIQITDFPLRHIVPIKITGLPEDAPELKLAELLQTYRSCREERLKQATKSAQTAAMLVVISLQKRLLSSIEAFARTLQVHRQAIERQVNTIAPSDYPLLRSGLSSDDDRAELDEADVEAEADTQMCAATQQDTIPITQQELALLDEMSQIAQQARREPDSRIQALIQWVQVNLCPDLGTAGATWEPRRVLIFTEYTDTKRYLVQQLSEAIATSDQAEQRIETFHGGIGTERREAIKAAFNADPHRHPLRILIATDAAREGVNLQNYCADLFHFDVPWNPSRMEQRNGRIDRKLQREPEVRCHYFVLQQRSEDRVLDTLVQKTKLILEELGSLSPVVEKRAVDLLERGIVSEAEHDLTTALAQVDIGKQAAQGQIVTEELEVIRERENKLRTQQLDLEKMLQESRQWLGLNDVHFREALSVSLEMVGAPGLQAGEADQWVLPALDQQVGGDASWAMTLDSLRPSRQQQQKLWEWRKETQIRPVIFRDPGTINADVVHLHLEHRLVQRLLGRFLAQGFLYHELSRACICRTPDPIPKVIIVGRLSLYGDRATRLHDEIIAVAAEWIAPEARGRGKLRPLSETEKQTVLQELETCFADLQLQQVTEAIQAQFKGYAPQDVLELEPHLERRAAQLTHRARQNLLKRGESEAQAMEQLLIEQRDRILNQQGQLEAYQLSLFKPDELRQVEADRRHWRIRVEELTQEIEQEPERIRQMYQVKVDRIEPVGLVYLWPLSS